MANKLFIPYLNPVKYHPVAPQQLPQYMSRHIERYAFKDTVPEWEEQLDYPQLFQTTDRIVQQVISEIGGVQIQLLDNRGEVIYTDTFEQKLQVLNNPGQWVYEHDMNLPGLNLADGFYFLKLSAGSGSPTVLISEPIQICSFLPDTLYLEYYHRSYYGTTYFETGIHFFMRIPARIKLKSVQSNDTIYEDQPLNETLVWSYPYHIEGLAVGGSYGIPDYLIKRLNWIFGCSFTSLDGIQYTKNEGAKWEERAFENYPLRGWFLEVRESLSRSAQVYDESGMQDRRFSIVAALDTKGFNDQSTGSEYSIIDVL